MITLHFHRDEELAPPPVLSVPTVVLSLLTAALINSSLRAGGLDPAGWSFSLALIVAAALVFRIKTPPRDLAPRLSKRFTLLFSILAALIVFQIVPLPLAVIRLISAAHGRAFDPLARAIPGAWFGTLSLAPSLSLVQIANLLACAAVLLLARELAWRLHQRVWLAASPILVAGAFQALLGFLQYAADPAHAVARGTYLNRNHYADFLAMCLPFAILYAWEIISRQRHHAPFSLLSALQVSALLFLAVAIVVAEFRSLSRLGVVSTLVSFVFVMALALPSRWSRLPVLGGFLALVAAAVMTMILLAPERVFVRFTGPSPADDAAVYDVRQPIWRDTARMIADWPAAGIGFGAFSSAFPFYQRELPNTRIGYAHNDYLQWVAELGFPGAMVLVLLLALLLGEALRASVPAVPTNTRSRAQRFALASTAALAAMMLHSFGDYNFCIPVNAMTFAWIAGLTAGIDPRLNLTRLRLGARSASATSPEQRPVTVTIIHPGATV